VPVAAAGNSFILTARDDTFLPYAGLPGVTTFDAVYAYVLHKIFSGQICQVIIYIFIHQMMVATTKNNNKKKRKLN